MSRRDLNLGGAMNPNDAMPEIVIVIEIAYILQPRKFLFSQGVV